MTSEEKARKKVEMAHRRMLVSTLFMNGKQQNEIVDIVKKENPDIEISQPTVSRDIRAMMKLWLKSALVDFDQAKANELAKVNLLEREYWEEWYRSKKQKIRQSVSTSEGQTRVTDAGVKDTPGHKRKSVTTETLLGNVAYLLGVERCIKARREILGLDAPLRIDEPNEFVIAIKTSKGLVSPEELNGTPPENS